MAHWPAGWLLIGFLLIETAPVFSQSDQAERAFQRMADNLRARPLQGLTHCGLKVEDLSIESIRGGLNERTLQREMAATLSALKLRTDDVPSLSGPFVSLNVSVTKLGRSGYTFVVLLELRELVTPERDKEALFLVTTWRQFGTGAADNNGLPLKVADTLALVLEDFRRDYSLANSQ